MSIEAKRDSDRPPDDRPRVDCWLLRHPVVVELGLVILAFCALSHHTIAMYVNGDRITGPVVEVWGPQGNRWVTIKDPATSRRYEARMPQFSPTKEFATVVVDPTDRSKVLSVADVSNGALAALGVAMLPVVWPVVVRARRRRRMHPYGQEIQAQAGSGAQAEGRRLSRTTTFQRRSSLRSLHRRESLTRRWWSRLIAKRKTAPE